MGKIKFEDEVPKTTIKYEDDVAELPVPESDKKQIISKHLKECAVDIDNVVVRDWLSPDEKYLIFLDELYDLENKTKLGDIWKKPDNLILFLEHSFRVSKFKKMFEDLPVLVVNNWGEITEELLHQTIELFKTKEFNYEKLKLSYWKNMI